MRPGVVSTTSTFSLPSSLIGMRILPQGLVIAFDFTLFNSGAKCALVDKTALDGEKKFNDIVRVAWDRLPAGMRAEALAKHIVSPGDAAQADLARFRTRVFVVSVLVLVCFFLLFAHLVYLQIFRHDDLRAQEIGRAHV